MKGYKDNIEKLTLENENFRKVLYTGKYSQLVLMAIEPKEEIGMEVHENHDQFFRFEAGQGKVIIDDNEYMVGDGDAVIVPAGSQHNVINNSETEILKLYTIYSPSEHRKDIIHKTKEEAENDDEEFDGVTTEQLLNKIKFLIFSGEIKKRYIESNSFEIDLLDDPLLINYQEIYNNKGDCCHNNIISLNQIIGACLQEEKEIKKFFISKIEVIFKEF